MMLGMTLETFTRVHVVISLIGVVSGLAVVFGMVAGRLRDGWTTLFLLSTALTSLTGFGFPFDHLLPSHKVGIVSLVVLAIVIVAGSRAHRGGYWRWIYPIGCVIALYLNVFVLIVQAFQKIPTLAAMAPTQSEPPFQLVQLVVFGIFGWLAVAAVRRFRS
jgi:hypothetical protein